MRFSKSFLFLIVFFSISNFLSGKAFVYLKQIVSGFEMKIEIEKIFPFWPSLCEDFNLAYNRAIDVCEDIPEVVEINVSDNTMAALVDAMRVIFANSRFNDPTWADAPFIALVFVRPQKPYSFEFFYELKGDRERFFRFLSRHVQQETMRRYWIDPVRPCFLNCCASEKLRCITEIEEFIESCYEQRRAD